MKRYLLSYQNKIYLTFLIVMFAGLNSIAQTTNTGLLQNAGMVSDYSSTHTNINTGAYTVTANNTVYDHANTTFTNDGTWDAVTGFTGAADNFLGNDGSGNPGSAVTIGGIIAPLFYNVNFDNGSFPLNITNIQGVQVANNLNFLNTITTTIRANGAAGGIHFLANATHNTLTPAIGADATFVDGYVEAVNPSSFVYPVGETDDLRPITATGTGTFSTAWDDDDVATVPGVSVLPAAFTGGINAIATNGYWEWSGAADATATVSIPDETSFAITPKLRVVGWNGAQWSVLGNSMFNDNTENSQNITTVTVPATISLITVGTLAGVVVQPKVFLQGATSIVGGIGTMSNTLNTLNLLPVTQPYNTAPFNYAGTEEVLNDFFTNDDDSIVDWVLVELRDAGNPATVVATRAGFVKRDGTIVDTDGKSAVFFPSVSSGNYYVAVKHRNHLGIRTPAPIALNEGLTSYDFTTAQNQAYQNGAITTNAAMRSITSGPTTVYAMWAGNGTADDRVSYTALNNDYTYLVSALSNNVNVPLINVYNRADYNMNGRVSYTALGNDYSFLVETVMGNNVNTPVRRHL